jgi:hypothetical protein
MTNNATKEVSFFIIVICFFEINNLLFNLFIYCLNSLNV